MMSSGAVHAARRERARNSVTGYARARARVNDRVKLCLRPGIPECPPYLHETAEHLLESCDET
eukprot:6264310-Prymnesium_polylepis.1